jgi:hypothetical protein
LFALIAKADRWAKYFVDDHGVSKATLQQVAHALLPCFQL